MFLKRWLRVSAARWWIFVLAAAVGTVGGLLLARSGNQSIQPVFEARAVFHFNSSSDTEQRNAPDTAENLAAADAAARAANAAVLDSGLATIATDDRAGTLTLSARARDGETAKATVTDMEMTYLVSAQDSVAHASEERIAEIVTEAGAILGQLETLAPPGTETIPLVDSSKQAELDFLSSQVDGLTQRSNQLAVDKVLAEVGDPEGRVGTPEEIEAELVLIEGKLSELYAQIAELTLGGATTTRTRPQQQTQSSQPQSQPSGRDTFEPVEPDSLEATWTIEALQARFEELRTEHQDLLIGSQDTKAPEDSLVPVEVADLSPEARSVPLTGALGAIAAVLLALGAVVAHYRLRGPIFVLQDLPDTIAGVEMPRALRTTRPQSSRKPGSKRASTLNRWFRRSKLARAGSVAAQRQVRARELRNAAVGWSETSALVGISGAGVEAREVEAVALELARTLAASDRSVLMLSLDFSKNAPRTASAGPTIADLLASVRRDPESSSVAVKQAMADAPVVAPNIRRLPAGTLTADPTDAFVTGAFRTLIEKTREQADVVLVVLSQLGEPATDLARQRMDGVIAVCRLGKTRRANLHGAAVATEGHLVGVVLLTKWPRLGLRKRLRSKTASVPAVGRPAPGRSKPRFGTQVRALVGKGAASRRLRSLNNGASNGSAPHFERDTAPIPSDRFEIDLDAMDDSVAAEPLSILGSSMSDGPNPLPSRKRRNP